MQNQKAYKPLQNNIKKQINKITASKAEIVSIQLPK